MRGTHKLVAIMIGGGLGAVVACQPEDPSCIQNLGIDITNVVVDAYNTTVRGTNGSGSWTFPCNGGGSAAITGTVNSSTVTFDLRFDFQNCMHDGLQLTGFMQDITTNGASNSTKTESATSDALTIYGDVIGCNADPIDATCDVSIFYSGSWTATICGLSYP